MVHFIVTAAVYWGFGLEPLLEPKPEQSPLSLTFQHRAGVSPYTSSYELAETCVFAKQSQEPFYCDLFALHQIGRFHATEAPLLPKLRGNFA